MAFCTNDFTPFGGGSHTAVSGSESGVGGDQAASLGNIAKSSSGTLLTSEKSEVISQEKQKNQENQNLDSFRAVARRFALQAGARVLLPLERVGKCYRRIRSLDEAVTVLYLPKHKRARLGGLQTCGSVWMCPVCAARITEARRVELAEAVKAARALGWRILFVTHTVRHKSYDRLSALVRDLLTARSRAVSGRAAEAIRRRFGIVGQIRALEVTYGQQNGFHPHFHELLFIDPNQVEQVGFSPDDLGLALLEQWATGCRLAKLRSVDYHGVDVRETDDDVAEYVAKFGREPSWTVEHEMSKAPVKIGRNGSRTPMQLLHQFTFGGDIEAGALFQDYARAFFGRKQLVWSHGLRQKLLPDQEEKSDQQLAEDSGAEAYPLASLTMPEQVALLRQNAHAELMAVGAGGDPLAVRDYLDRLVALDRGDRETGYQEAPGARSPGRSARPHPEGRGRTERPDDLVPEQLKPGMQHIRGRARNKKDREFFDALFSQDGVAGGGGRVAGNGADAFEAEGRRAELHCRSGDL